MTAPTTSRSTGTEHAPAADTRGEAATAVGAPLVFGLDLSLTGTGIAHLRNGVLITDRLVQRLATRYRERDLSRPEIEVRASAPRLAGAP